MPAVVLVLLAIELVDELVFGAREAAWPVIRDDLSLDYVQIGILLSLPLLVANIIEIPLAFLGDTRHRKLVIVAGGGVFIASVLLVGLSGSFWPLLVALLLFSPASGAFVSLAQASLADVDAGRREQNMARWTAAGSLGVLGGAFAIGLVGGLDEGWRLVFFAIAALSAIVLTVAAHQPVGVTAAAEEAQPLWAGLRQSLVWALKSLQRPDVIRW